MSGHHDATKPYQPRRGPERPPPELPQPAEDEEAAAAAAAMAALQPQPEPDPGAMEQYEQHPEHEEEGHEEEEEEEEEGEEDGEEGIEYGYEYGNGEAVPMDASAAGEHAQHGAMALTAGVQQPAANTLTLSFQGEAFVFENVSAEKVRV